MQLIFDDILTTYYLQAQRTSPEIFPTTIEGQCIYVSDGPVGVYFPQQKRLSYHPGVHLAYNCGLQEEHLATLIQAVETHRPEGFCLQECPFVPGQLAALRDLGYYLEVYPYLFGRRHHSCLVLGYSEPGTRGALVYYPGSSFPPVSGLLRKYDIEQIMTICPLRQSGDMLVGTFHNSSYTNHVNRMGFLKFVCQEISRMSPGNLLVAGDANLYGANIDNTPRQWHRMWMRRLSFAPWLLASLRERLQGERIYTPPAHLLALREFESFAQKCGLHVEFAQSFKITLPYSQIRLYLDGYLATRPYRIDQRTISTDHTLQIFTSQKTKP